MSAASDPTTELYRQSSQYRHWTFSTTQLDEIREQVHAQGLLSLAQSRHLEEKLNQKESITLEQLDLIPESKESSLENVVSWQEQLSYCRYWESKIMNYCTVFQLDHTVQATAITLFKRFYLRHTVMDHDPRVLLMTSLFLSCKIENCTLSLREYLKKVPNAPAPEKMMDLEFQLSTGLNFEYNVHHGYWPMHGYFLDFQSFLQSLTNSGSESASVSRKSLDKSKIPNLIKDLLAAHTKATTLITSSLLTDACFLYTPSQIGLSSLWSATREYPELHEWMELYISHTFRGERPDIVVRLREKMEEFRVMVESFTQTDAVQAKKVDTKLKQCRNPRYEEGSALYNWIKEEEARIHAEKKRIKVEEGLNDKPAF